MDIDFVARAPRGSEVEELTQKQLLKCLRNKIPINQYLEMSGFESTGSTREPREERGEEGGGRGERRDERREERRDERGGGRREDRERAPPPRPMAPPPPPPPPAPPLTPELQRYFDLLDSVENASKSLFVGEGDAIVGEAPVKDMIDALASLAAPAKAVVFDGIVSQRLLDVAQEKGILTVVATRLGPVGKMPENVRVFTKADLSPSGTTR